MLSPMEMNGMLQRQQDIGMIRQNELLRPVVEHEAMQTRIERQIEHDAHQVKEGEDAENYMHKFDAREKGSNEYQGGHHTKDKKRRKKESLPAEGFVKKDQHIDIMI